METTSLMDLIAGGLALVVLIGGLLMLFNGISAFGDKDKCIHHNFHRDALFTLRVPFHFRHNRTSMHC